MKHLKVILFIVSLALFSFSSVTAATYEADFVPWSGYWWPFSEGGLVTGSDYRNHPAPLEKYDLVESGVSNGPATQYGRRHYYNPNALAWEGLCFNWAAAAILEEEPKAKSIYRGTTFLVGDKKGLLTVAYDGTLCNRTSVNDPGEFHRILETLIRDQHTPVILDLGTNGEVWCYPVFKYSSSYTQQGMVRHYTTTVYYVSDGVSPDYVGSQIMNETYDYYFELDAGGAIIASGWEGPNRYTPPKVAYEPFGTVPNNPGIDLERVREIAATVDDGYEENDSFEVAALLTPGTYDCLSLDKDVFAVFLAAGDTLRVTLETMGGDNVSLKSFTPQKTLIGETHDSSHQTITADQNGDYFLSVEPVAGADSPFYTLVIQQELHYRGVLPKAPTGSWVNEIALLDPGKNGGRLILTHVNNDGCAEKSYSDASFSGYVRGEGKTLLNADSASSNNGYLMVDTDYEIRGAQRVSYGDYLCLGSNYIPASSAVDILYFPHVTRVGGWKTFVGIINLGDRTEEVLLESYDASGVLLGSYALELGPGNRVEYDAGALPCCTSETRSMTASARSGRNCLVGSIEFWSPGFSAWGRGMVPLPLERDTTLIIPHVASSRFWSTGIAVVNTGGAEAAVTFTAYDASGTTIGSQVHRTLQAGQNLAQTAAQLFGYEASTRIASVNILSTQPLAGFVMYVSTNLTQLAGVPAWGSASSRTPLYLSLLDISETWSTGMAVVNASLFFPTETAVMLCDGDGNTLALQTRFLQPHQRLAATVQNLFGGAVPENARYLVVDAAGDQPLCGLFMTSSRDGLKLMGGVLD